MNQSTEEVQQEAGPDVIWRLAHGWRGAAWLHSFRVWPSHCLYLDHAYLTLVPQGYSALFVSILSGESKELITLMKARGYSGEKASSMISIRLV